MRESQDTKKFEYLLNEKIQELGIKLVDSNTPIEKIGRVNKIDTLGCVIEHLNNLRHSAGH